MDHRRWIDAGNGVRIEGTITGLFALLEDGKREPVSISEIDESSVTLESISVPPISVSTENFVHVVLQDSPTFSSLGATIARGMQASQLSEQEDRLLALCTEPIYFSQAHLICAVKHCRKSAPMAVLVEDIKAGFYLIKPLCNWHMNEHISQAAMIRASEHGEKEPMQTYPVGDEG